MADRPYLRLIRPRSALGRNAGGRRLVHPPTGTAEGVRDRMTVLSTSVAHEEWTRLSPAAALAVTARVVNSSLRLDDVLRTVVRLTCQVLDADRATILLFDQQQ